MTYRAGFLAVRIKSFKRPGRGVAATFLCLLGAGLASAASGQTITEFPIPGPSADPFGIVAGPDGNLWFTSADFDAGRVSLIGRITPSGAISEFPLSNGLNSPCGITAGPDGNLWFTECGTSEAIGRITPAGVITEFGTRVSQYPLDITAGPDGNLWFTVVPGNIGRITPAGAITAFPIPTPNSGPSRITVGPDGALWFTESTANKIGRITTAGAIAEFTIPTPNSGPSGITVGPDSALWFTESTANNIGRITTAGAIAEFPISTPNSGPSGITVGPDGALWFTESTANKIGRITTAGAIAEFPIPTPNSGPFGITVGPDGVLWFTEITANKIGRITTGAAAPCSLNYITLCLGGGRFAVTASWRTSTGSGAGTAGQLTGGNSGYFSFFDTSNVELVVKVLNGCALSNSYWVFAGGLTNVEVTLKVTDTQTGATRIYLSPLGTPFQPILDTSAFATCP